MTEGYARHDLVWLDAGAAWQSRTPGAQARLQAWLDAGYPAIVARRDPADADDRLRLGVPLPPAEDKRRLSLSAPRASVTRQRAPLALDEVRAQAPADWQAPLQDLQALGEGLQLQPRVFGAFAWQALTGLRYVHVGSDIDLLWRVPAPAQARALVAQLAQWEQRHGRRADGELLLPDGSGVSWREWAGDSAQVLVKAASDCRLRARAELLQTWGA